MRKKAFFFEKRESDVNAHDSRLEVGYGPLAIHYNKTRYEEENPSDELDVKRVYGLYHMSLGSQVEVDLGLGKLTMNGNSHNSRRSFTMPILIHASEYIGFELRPAWASNIEDYDASALFSWRYLSLKLGYRWLDRPNESLKSPYAGSPCDFDDQGNFSVQIHSQQVCIGI
ncbi:MAG: hypothetical protein IME96_04770 [Proteobacteria bacterium]|nr:hypothetical protein [Pseudomonadota bacterium]